MEQSGSLTSCKRLRGSFVLCNFLIGQLKPASHFKSSQPNPSNEWTGYDQTTSMDRYVCGQGWLLRLFKCNHCIVQLVLTYNLHFSKEV